MYLRKIKFLQMMVTSLVLALLSICLIGCDTDGPIDLTVKDASGNIYPTTKIGGQIWMAKNLNTKTKGSWCYDNDSDNCEKYGRLYTWKAAKAACPDGWHLPSKEEFESLLDKVGSSGEERSAKLRVSFWADGKNKYGFSALPAGERYSYVNEYIGKRFLGLDGYALFWSSTDDKYDAYFMTIGAGDTRVDVSPNPDYGDKDFGYSVRCLKDDVQEVNSGELGKGIEGLISRWMKDLDDFPTVKIGNQEWMTKNMNIKTEGSICYDNNAANCEKYGRFYSWEDAKKVCPAGWRLPSIEDFKTLFNFVENKYTTLMSRDGWEEVAGNNQYGLDFIPSGHYSAGEGEEGFWQQGRYTCLWTSSTKWMSGYDVYVPKFLELNHKGYSFDSLVESYVAAPVRCLKDSNEAH